MRYRLPGIGHSGEFMATSRQAFSCCVFAEVQPLSGCLLLDPLRAPPSSPFSKGELCLAVPEFRRGAEQNEDRTAPTIGNASSLILHKKPAVRSTAVALKPGDRLFLFALPA